MLNAIKTFFKNHSRTISKGAKVAGAVVGVAGVAAGGYVAYKHYSGGAGTASGDSNANAAPEQAAE